MNANFKTALAGGVLISLLPAWLISTLLKTFPNLRSENLEIVSDFLANEGGIAQIVFFLMVIFIIPVIEELIFRGGLWKLIEWKLSPYWTWIFISIVFAAIHIDPLQSLGLLPFSFFAGWLRYKTGKINLSIVAHISNNAVGCLLMMI